jgi:DNA topoisomerase-3
MNKQTEFVTKYVNEAKSSVLQLPTHKCPTCKSGTLRQIKGSKGAFWGCSRYQQGCKTSFEDKKGGPDLSGSKSVVKAKQSPQPAQRHKISVTEMH